MPDNQSRPKKYSILPYPAQTLVLVLAALSMMAVWPSQSLAHGVHINGKPGQAMILDIYYDGGDPMSFAKVKISGPSGKTYQVGNTDAFGRFSFLPNKQGQWTAVVNDGMGHRAEIKITASPDGQASTEAASPVGQGTPVWARAMWGLSAVMFIFGLLSWLAARRKVKAS